MVTSLRWTSADLDAFPDDDKRYEIIDGELYASKQPSWERQLVCLQIGALLFAWSRQSGAGVTNGAPGIIFADNDDVAPDVIWISKERLSASLAEDRKLHSAPDLVVEVLSPGTRKAQRDKAAQLNLYSRRGVREYWIVDWVQRHMEVFRRADSQLRLVQTLHAQDTVASPLLPGLAIPLADFFLNITE